MNAESGKFKRPDGPLRVMVLHAPTGIGGAEGVILNMNRYIDHREVQLFNCPFINFGRGKSLYLEELKTRRITYDAMPLVRRFDHKYISATRRLIAKHVIDVIHTHGYRSDVIGILAAGGRIPVVSTVHGFTASTSRVRIYETLQRMFLKRMKVVIPVSEPIEQGLLRLGIPKEQVSRLANVVDVKSLVHIEPSSIFKDVGAENGAFKIVFVGRLSPEKGLDVLLRACMTLDREGVPYSLLVVGDGPLRREYEAYTAREGLTSRVRFCGFRRDATAIMAASDVFVLPSRTEGIPLVVLEAMALGKVVIASRVGGIPQLITSGVNGQMVDPEDANSFASALKWTYQHPQEAGHMANAALDYVKEHCDPDRWASELTNIYRHAIGMPEKD